MTAHDDFGVIDPDEIDLGTGSPPPSRRRRWMVPAALVGVLAVGGVGGWLLTRDGGSSSSDSSSSSAPEPAGDGVEFDGGAPGDGSAGLAATHMIVGSPPDDLAVFQAFDADASDGGFEPSAPAESAVLLAQPGATASTGASVMVIVTAYDDTFLSEESPGPDAITVGDTSWYVYENGGEENVMFPVDKRWNVDLTTRRRSRAELAALANSIDVDDDGTIVFHDGTLIAGYEQVIEGEVLMAMQSGAGTHSSMVMYATPGGDFSENVNLTVTPMPPVDFAPMFRLFVDGPVDLVVHDLPALGGENDDDFGGQAVIVWQEDGNLIILTGSYSVEELLPIAESVREATDEEWDEALNAFDPSSFEPDGLDDSNFVVGAGDIGDRRTWIVEASFDDGFQACANTDNYSSCMTTSDAEVDATNPILQIVSGSDDGSIGTIIAVVDRSIAGAVLRITPTDGDPILVPLHEVDATFPGPAAAGAYLLDTGGTAELLDAAGAVLATLDLTAVG